MHIRVLLASDIYKQHKHGMQDMTMHIRVLLASDIYKQLGPIGSSVSLTFSTCNKANEWWQIISCRLGTASCCHAAKA